MLTLKHYLKREEQKITEALHREVALLDPAIQPLVLHTLKAGGKRMRPVLAVLMSKALVPYGSESDCTEDELYSLGSAVELIHSATLMHDDVMDGAELRRGKPAAHQVFGVSQCIMAGDVLLAAAVLIVLRHKNYRIMECCARAVERTATGQVLETQSLRNPHLPLETYMRIIQGKTAALISCACEVGALQAGVSDELVEAAAEFGLQVGIAFQLVDDALDIAPMEEIGKPTGGDLREAKFTLPLYFYLQSLSNDERADFERRFASGGFNAEEIDGVVLKMRAAGCGERTREEAGKHLALAEKALLRLPPSRERDLLMELSSYVRTRKL